MTHGSLYKFSNIKEKLTFYGKESKSVLTMLSYPALQKLHDKLISAAETVLRSNDKKVLDLISRLEDQMTPLDENHYNYYCEIENKMINYYYSEDLQRYFVSASGKFSINNIKDDLKAYDQAYKACQKFIDLYREMKLESGRCYILDQDNDGITDDRKAHDKYETWFNIVSEFQNEIYNEIQDQVNEQMSTFRSTVELVESKLQAIESEEDEEW